MALQVRELMSWDDAAGLEPRWEALVERNATDTVFLSYAWLRTWWQHFGKGSRLLLLVVESGDELVGAAPLMIDRQPLSEGGAARVRFTANWQTMRMDLLAAPEERQAVVAAVTDYLLRQAPRWDVLDLDLVPSESENLAVLDSELQSRGLRTGRMERGQSPYLPLGCSWDELRSRLSRNVRHDLSRKRRILDRQAATEFIPLTPASEVDVLRKCFAVSRESWQGRLGPTSSISSSSAMEQFYTDVWHVAGERGWRSGGVLEVAGRPAAFGYCLDYHRKIHFLKIGYDPAYKQHSPGLLLVELMLQEACRAGREELDFLGECKPWKQRWTDLTRRHVRFLAFRRGLRARASHAVLFVLRPRVKRLPGVQRLQRLIELATRRQRPSRGGDE